MWISCTYIQKNQNVTDECDVLVSDPPSKHYNTYLQNGSITSGKMSEVGAINGENHLQVTNGNGMYDKNGYQASEEIDYFEAKSSEPFSFYSRHLYTIVM
jgi:hypothetical protein